MSAAVHSGLLRLLPVVTQFLVSDQVFSSFHILMIQPFFLLVTNLRLKMELKQINESVCTVTSCVYQGCEGRDGDSM